MKIRVRVAGIVLSLLSLSTVQARSEGVHAWEPPTPEELSMKSLPEVPDAPAVILDYQEMDDDVVNHSHSVYEKIKILTEKGKKYADVELTYAADVAYYDNASENYTDIAGRTIQPDGTITPFTGKPYIKTLEKSREGKVLSKVFTLPDVQVGSIIEYRYSYRYPDNIVSAPDWQLQQGIYMKHGTFIFKASPKDIQVGRGDSFSTNVEWVTRLPKDAKIITQAPIASSGIGLDPGYTYTLNVHDIEPVPDEELMPPIGTFTMKVNFYYFGYSSLDKYWVGEGKYHSGLWNKFMDGGGNIVRGALGSTIATGDTDEIKLKKIYNAVQALDNTDFSREHTKAEDRAQGLKDINNAGDVLSHKGGDSNDLTLLFVAMARSAGFKAYIMDLTTRDHRLFDKSLPRWSQMNHMVAIVNVGGKEEFFDPGEKYCKFGQLAWQDSESGGVRQTDGGTIIAVSSFMNYKQSMENHAAVLALDDTGVANGNMQEAFDGIPALYWRQKSLEGTADSLKHDLEKDMTGNLPGGMEVTMTSIANLTDPDKPLVVNFTAKGPIGTKTGKRVLIPGDIFKVNSHPMLTAVKRLSAVDLKYNLTAVDVEQITLPQSMQVDTLPDKQSTTYKNEAVYSITPTSSGNTFTVKRVYVLGEYLFLPADYAALKDYFNKVSQGDQEFVLVKQGASAGGN